MLNVIPEIDHLLKLGEFLRVIEICGQKTNSDSAQFTDYCYLGIAYLLNNQPDEAEFALTSAFLLFSDISFSDQSNFLLGVLDFAIDQQLLIQNFNNVKKLVFVIIDLFGEEFATPYFSRLEQEIEALTQKANHLKVSQQYSTAEEYYLKITDVFSDKHQVWYNLAEIYFYEDKYTEALDAITKALTIDPSFADYHHLFGLIAEKKNNFIVAKQAYESALEQCATHSNSYHRLLLIEQKYRNYPRVIELLHKAIKALPNQVSFYHLLVIAYQENGEMELADKTIDTAIALFPRNLSFKRLKQALLPIIYKTENDVFLYRKNFIKKLNNLVSSIELDTQEKIDDAFQMLTSYTNFFLYYQNQNDVEILRTYGLLAQKITFAKYPQFYSFQPRKKKDKKIRIGYFSSRLDTIGNLFIGWLNFANLENFEVHTYFLNYFNFRNDISVSNYQQASQKFYNFVNPHFETVCQTILNDNLDILVFLELGMEARLTPYGCVRLSPIQCVAWGHPITSGLPEIDYFLSSEAMESTVGEKHYTEKLIRLAGMGIICPQPEAITLTSNKPREYFNLSEDDCIYLCCQYFCKYLPQHDYIFSSIAVQVSNAKFIFIERYNQDQKNTNILKQRLQDVFAQNNLDYNNFCIFIPPLDLENYHALMKLSDIFLDTLGWTGGVTTLDAIAHDLPIVTCPGELLRSRQSYGLLKTLGITDTIASTEKKYIDIAVGLGKNPQQRKTISAKLKSRKHLIYYDLASITSLEEFYKTVIDKSLSDH